MKVCVTQYVPQNYETTRTTYRTEWKEEKFTAVRCEMATEQRTRPVTTYRSVPETHEVVVSRWECVPMQEERTVTRNVMTCKPVTHLVSRCVDRGGHYECREVACGSMGHAGCGRGCHRSSCGSDCCAPVTQMVSCYVPNYVTEQVPVTVMQSVCEQVSEKVMVTTYRQVEKKETVKVTTYKCVPETHQEAYTVSVMRQVPYEASRKVAVCVPVQERVTCTRMVPVTVEKEVTVACAPAGCAEECGSCGKHRGGLCRRGCR